MKAAHPLNHSPGLMGKNISSVWGDAIKTLHSRERRFYNNFGSRSPQAEMHIKIYISPSREYDPEPTIPLAGIASFSRETAIYLNTSFWFSCHLRSHSFLDTSWRPCLFHSKPCLWKKFLSNMRGLDSLPTSLLLSRHTFFSLLVIVVINALSYMYGQSDHYHQGCYCWGKMFDTAMSMPSPEDWRWMDPPRWKSLWTTLPEARMSSQELIRCSC